MIYTAQCTLLVLHDGVILLTDNACNCEHPEQDPVKHHGHVHISSPLLPLRAVYFLSFFYDTPCTLFFLFLAGKRGLEICGYGA